MALDGRHGPDEGDRIMERRDDVARYPRSEERLLLAVLAGNVVAPTGMCNASK